MNTFILDLTCLLSSVFGLIALLLYQLADIQLFDAIGAFLIGLIIGASSIVLIFGVKDYLTGKTASTETEKMIRDAVMASDAVTSITELNTMYIGSEKILVHLDVVLKYSKASSPASVVDQIKADVKKAVPLVYSIQVETISH